MSGGSFNYLYSRQLDENAHEIDIIADYVDELGFPELAERTREAAKALELAEAIREELTEVWRTIEWWQSGDEDKDGARESIAEWKAKRTKQAEGEVEK